MAVKHAACGKEVKRTVCDTKIRRLTLLPCYVQNSHY
jgi:hypothetical protein